MEEFSTKFKSQTKWLNLHYNAAYKIHINPGVHLAGGGDRNMNLPNPRF